MKYLGYDLYMGELITKNGKHIPGVVISLDNKPITIAETFAIAKRYLGGLKNGKQ